MNDVLAFKRQVALKLQNSSCVLQPLDRPHTRYVVAHEPVCGSHFLGFEQIDSEDLREREGETQRMERRAGLRPLLLGPPLTERQEDKTLTALDSHLEGVADLLPKVYGNNEASQQAQMQFKKFLQMESDRDGVLCKRAALLFALGREKELGTFFSEQERAIQGNDGRPTYLSLIHI